MAKLAAAVEADVLVASEQELVLERGIETIPVYLAVTGHDAGQAQYGLPATAIITATHLENGVAERPDYLLFYEHRRRLFPGKPAYRDTRFV